ncbi:beta-L-arabinofuranosidase domain-containing protein [Thermostilla marina]
MQATRFLVGVVVVLAATVFGASATCVAETGVEVVGSPPTERPNSHYVSNRRPLTVSPFVKLPIGAIRPQGWLRRQLELERDGQVGHLEEISRWLDFERSAWTDPQGQGEYGWEEMPYWLKGYGDLAYVLGDEQMIANARRWIEAVMASQRDDGWFGPRGLLTSLGDKPDLWPHMIMLNVLQSYYEYTHDERALEVMLGYMRWENTLPVSAFGEGYWPRLRAGDNIESVFWVYNRTGEPWLLDLARKIHAGMARWDEDVINWHNVNIAQGFRAGTVFWMLSKDEQHLLSAERNWRKVMAEYGRFPGGGFVGDENCRPGYVDPRGGIETCGIVEFMHSYEMLTKITGDPVWAERCEEIAFNTFPAAMTPEQKGLHYITCVNQVQLDRNNKSPGIQNRGMMFAYSPHSYRCCQHNVSHGWPYYAEELWTATADDGLCLSLFAASTVTAKVGDGTEVTVREETDYPFDETIRLTVETPATVRFPLYVRKPSWTNRMEIGVNDEQPVVVETEKARFVRLTREWKAGDRVTVRLPMSLRVTRWPNNQNAASIAYGPLHFSLLIEERWEPFGDDPNWPNWEVFPASPWNYGLVLDDDEPTRGMRLVRTEGPLAAQPFTPETVPLRLIVKAKRIPNWKLDRLGMIDKLQPSPVCSAEPVEEITLIPMGAARLRLGMFPVIGEGPDAHEWTPPPLPPASKYKVTASYCYANDSVQAVGDGLEPRNSNDHSIPRQTFWPHKGTQEWIAYNFDAPKTVRSVAVYWFDDAPQGGCRIPAAWRILYREGDAWLPVANAKIDPVRKDAWNRATFEPVTTTGLRLEIQLQPEFSGGVLEWKVE